MTKSTPIAAKPQAYGLFALAAAIYATGVVTFSAWSYFQHRSIAFAQIDQVLINATHATEQILGSIFIECAVETETFHEFGYAANQAELSRFSKACYLDAAGAAARKGTNVWSIITGPEYGENIPADDIHFKDPLNPSLSSIVQQLAHSKTEHIRVQNILHEKHGRLRIAIRYHAISDDAGYALVAAQNIDYVDDLMRDQIIHKVSIGLFLLIMAFPLIALYNRAQTTASRKMEELNTQLKQDFIKLKERETELEDAIRDLERFNAVAVGRESRIIDLKGEVNTLLEQMKRQKRYNIDRVE
jgi:hypothetical protein